MIGELKTIFGINKSKIQVAYKCDIRCIGDLLIPWLAIQCSHHWLGQMQCILDGPGDPDLNYPDSGQERPRAQINTIAGRQSLESPPGRRVSSSRA